MTDVEKKRLLRLAFRLTNESDAARIYKALVRERDAAAVRTAKEYGHHKWGCYSGRGFERECDCGLYALRGPR